jgi:hypothetical protein
MITKTAVCIMRDHDGLGLNGQPQSLPAKKRCDDNKRAMYKQCHLKGHWGSPSNSSRPAQKPRSQQRWIVLDLFRLRLQLIDIPVCPHKSAFQEDCFRRGQPNHLIIDTIRNCFRESLAIMGNLRNFLATRRCLEAGRVGLSALEPSPPLRCFE